jgi:hypothetical protein
VPAASDAGDAGTDHHVEGRLMSGGSSGLRQLQQALRSLEGLAVAARKPKGLPWSRREAARDAQRRYAAAGLDARRIGEWLGDPGRAPRDPDQVWALVQVWSAWAGEGRGRQKRQYWNNLVEIAQPLPKPAGESAASSTDARSRSGQVKSSDLSAILTSLLEVHGRSRGERRRWYHLEEGVFPVPQDTGAARRTFLIQLLNSLGELFGDTPTRFTLALTRTKYSPEGPPPPLPFYSILSHRREFVAQAARSYKEHMTRIIHARLHGSNVEAFRAAFVQQNAEAERKWTDWQVEVNAVFLPAPVPHLINYEPSLRRVSIGVSPLRGTNPAEYDDKVATMSEALAYACSFADQAFPHIGDLRWYSRNRALTKLALHFLDERVLDFSRFRVAHDDPETWDFHYPTAEEDLIETLPPSR